MDALKVYLLESSEIVIGAEDRHSIIGCA